MNKLSFDKEKLLENLEIRDFRTHEKIISLVNKNVEILLYTEDGNIILHGFNKGKEKAHTRGIARCALYVLLLELLKGDVIQKNDTMKVSDPTDLGPKDGGLERLMKIYTQIGFTMRAPEPGNPINLVSTIQNLIDTLKDQCEIAGGGKRRKRKTKKRRKYRRKKIKTRRKRTTNKKNGRR